MYQTITLSWMVSQDGKRVTARVAKHVEGDMVETVLDNTFQSYAVSLMAPMYVQVVEDLLLAGWGIGDQLWLHLLP